MGYVAVTLDGEPLRRAPANAPFGTRTGHLVDNCNGTYTATVTIFDAGEHVFHVALGPGRQPEFRRRRDPRRRVARVRGVHGRARVRGPDGGRARDVPRTRRRRARARRPNRARVALWTPSATRRSTASSRGTICASSRKSTTCATPSSNSRRYETPPRIRRARISTPCSCPRRLVGTNSPSISTPATDRASRARRGRRRRRCPGTASPFHSVVSGTGARFAKTFTPSFFRVELRDAHGNYAGDGAYVSPRDAAALPDHRAT